MKYKDKSGDIRLFFISHYLGDQWVFMDKITYSIDRNNQTKNMNNHDIMRDNIYGNVWETYGITGHEDERDLLWAIGNSSKTIVRFEGTNRYQDITISDNDKSAMLNAVVIYDPLIANYVHQAHIIARAELAKEHFPKFYPPMAIPRSIMWSARWRLPRQPILA